MKMESSTTPFRLNQLGMDEPIWTSVIPHGNESYELAKLVVATGPDTHHYQQRCTDSDPLAQRWDAPLNLRVF